jgi:hypothetical protein
MKTQAAAEEVAAYRKQVHLFRDCPIPNEEIPGNMSLFLDRPSLSQVLFLEQLYNRFFRFMESSSNWGRDGGATWRR